jgi:proteic killer suppression protein
MIKTFRHKGLKKFYEKGDFSKIRPEHRKKIRLILTIITAAKEIRDINYPGSNLHQLSGNYQTFWSVSVSGNWRIIFKFEDGDALDLDYLDYH